MGPSCGFTAATGNANFGYVGGGGYGTPDVSTVQRIDYSNDTATALVRGPLSEVKYGLAATGSTSFGYFAGGTVPAAKSTVDRIDYSNDTATASVKGPLSSAKQQFAACSSRANAMPLKGPAVLDVPVSLGAFSRNFGPQGTDFGYFGGGQSPNTPVSTVDRIDYSNDTATAVAKGPLSVATAGAAATGNASFGYFGGGVNPSVSPSSLSTVSRIDYSNDTATAVAKGPLSLARYGVTGTGNADFGYFGGGGPALSTVDRIDYSNDTATAVAKGPISPWKQASTATGNASFGYFGGGLPNNSKCRPY